MCGGPLTHVSHCRQRVHMSERSSTPILFVMCSKVSLWLCICVLCLPNGMLLLACIHRHGWSDLTKPNREVRNCLANNQTYLPTLHHAC